MVRLAGAVLGGRNDSEGTVADPEGALSEAGVKRASVLVPAGCLATLLVALVFSDAGTWYFLTIPSGEAHLYGILLVLQLLIGVAFAAAVATAISLAGSTVRWFGRRAGWQVYGRTWRLASPEAIIVAVALSGTLIGYSRKDIYQQAYGAARLEIRPTSLIETPLSWDGGSSRGISPVVVMYDRDDGGRVIVDLDYEFIDRPPGSDRSIRWSGVAPPRVVVELGSGFVHFFPDQLDDDGVSATEDVVEAYLAGEPMEVVRQALKKAEADVEEDSGGQRVSPPKRNSE